MHLLHLISMHGGCSEGKVGNAVPPSLTPSIPMHGDQMQKVHVQAMRPGSARAHGLNMHLLHLTYMHGEGGREGGREGGSEGVREGGMGLGLVETSDTRN